MEARSDPTRVGSEVAARRELHRPAWRSDSRVGLTDRAAQAREADSNLQAPSPDGSGRDDPRQLAELDHQLAVTSTLHRYARYHALSKQQS